MKSSFFSSTQHCISLETLKMSTHECWTGWLKTLTIRHQQHNCFVSFLSILPLTVHVSSIVTLNWQITICKYSWSLWSQGRPLEPNSSSRNYSMCLGLSIDFWRRQWVQSKATTQMMKKSLASWRICFSISFMAFLSTSMISSRGLWRILLCHHLSWSLMLLEIYPRGNNKRIIIIFPCSW